jgi:hypothetical protein
MSGMADQVDERAAHFGTIAKGLGPNDPWKSVCEFAQYWLHRAAQEIRDRDEIMWPEAKALIGRPSDYPVVTDEEG